MFELKPDSASIGTFDAVIVNHKDKLWQIGAYFWIAGDFIKMIFMSIKNIL